LIVISIICIGVTSVIVYNFKYKVSEESIISDFNENYEYFSDVEKYINENKFDRICANKDDNSVNVKVKLSKDDKNESNNNLPIKSQMEYICNKLNYESILAEKGYGLDNFIVFERECKDGLEQGIVYLIDDDGKYGATMVKIRDGWYYYTIGYV
jgi:hypothetical protein